MVDVWVVSGDQIYVLDKVVKRVAPRNTFSIVERTRRYGVPPLNIFHKLYGALLGCSVDKYATTSRSSLGESKTLMVGMALTGPNPAASFALGSTKLSSKPRRSYRVATPSSDGPACPPPPAIAWQRKHCDAEFAATMR